MADYVDTAINLAETRVAEEADYERFRVSESFNFLSGTDNETLDFLQGGSTPTNYEVVGQQTTTIDPSKFLWFVDVWYVDANGDRHKLEKVEQSFIEEYRSNSTSYGIPKYYSIKDSSPEVLIFAPYALSTTITGLDVVYAAEANFLSSSNSTNVILQKVPNLLRVAALIEMSEFMKNRGAVDYWNMRYTADLARHLNVTRRERQDAGESEQRANINRQTSVGSP
jgi:hypothetical protein